MNLAYVCATKVASITKGTEGIAYGYDGSLVTSETLSGTLNGSLAYGYNSDLNPTSFTYAGGLEALEGVGPSAVPVNARNAPGK